MGIRSFRFRKLAALVASTSLCASLLVVTAAPVGAASYPLDNTDPSVTCAAEATTPGGHTTNIYDSSGSLVGKIELRFGSVCLTAWGRITNLLPRASYIKVQIHRNNDGVNAWSHPTIFKLGGNGAQAFSYQLYDAGSLTSYAVGYICDWDNTCSAVHWQAQTANF